jgi:hypothetical protein
VTGGRCARAGWLNFGVRTSKFELSRGADDRDRTGDLVLTKDALCQLSYIGPPSRSAPAAGSFGEAGPHPRRISAPPPTLACPDEAVSAANVWRSLERETGIEPATNSLEGCDSTTELLPPFSKGERVRSERVRGPKAPVVYASSCSHALTLSPFHSLPPASNGGEGRTRTFEAARATDLQSAAFDRFATSPNPTSHSGRRSPVALSSCRLHIAAHREPLSVRHLTRTMKFLPMRLLGEVRILELAKGFEPPTG